MDEKQCAIQRNGVTRRTFMAGALAAGVAGVLGSMGARSAEAAETGAPSTNGSWETPPDPVPDDQIVETVDCDVIVVGAGVAGMPGIIYAAQQGLNVHVLEKGPTQGVHRLNVSGLNAEYAKNFSDQTIDPKDFTTDMYRCSGGFQSKNPVVARYANHSGKLIDWMMETVAPYGWSLLPMQQAATGYNQRLQGTWEPWPTYDCAYLFCDDQGNNLGMGVSPNWMELFREIAEKGGATFHFNEAGYYLEREGDKSGRVTGVVSRDVHSGKYRRYNASNGVLLTAGDFFNDKEMVHKYCSFLERCTSSICEPQNTGDMHKAGIWIGAAMDDYSAGDLFAFENADCNNWASPVPGDPDYSPILDNVRGTMWAPALAGYPVLWVDDGGRRFVNEGVNNFQQAGAQALLTTPTGQAWSIWDGAWESKFPDDWATNSPGGVLLTMMSVNTQSEIDREVDLGLIKKFDTLDELIDECGFDAEYFQATLDRYNALCDEGYDHDCYKEPKWMTKVDTPPFYAAHWGVMVTSTRCGLKTDENARVIDTQGQIIPSLYAAGNNGGNFYGVNYPGTFGGTGIAHGQFYSWVAAHDMNGESLV